jgi:hypothetical protein
MTHRYLGHLAEGDPLHSYLQSLLAAPHGSSPADARYRVFQFADSRDVYLYQEVHSGARLVGKFFRSSDPAHARWKGETEFNNLTFLRRIGFDSRPHYVVQPYGFNPFIDNVLVLEYLEGESLSALINRALYCGRGDRLLRKLSALADFLAQLHNRTAGDGTIDFEMSHGYFLQLVGALVNRWGMRPELADQVCRLGWGWHETGAMWRDRAVLVHGDMTPANVLFGRGLEVMAIDLERMKWADRVFDLGRLCGELKHHFFRATADPMAAEPFIGHFLRQYCCHFPDRESAFHAVTRRLPYYLGMTLLRIARNSWIDPDYRRRLLREAVANLRG